MLDIINILNGNDPEAEVIYTDFNFEQDEDCSLNSDLAPVGQCQQQWGVHENKPIAQVNWEIAVSKEVESMVTENMEDY